MKIFNFFFVIVFIVFAALQYNDPDPYIWVPLYLYAALLCWLATKKKFNKPVLANIDDNDVWRVGFITHEDATEFDLIDHAAVYIPLAYSITGITYLVPKQKIKLLHNISSGEAMKFTVSGGVSDVE